MRRRAALVGLAAPALLAGGCANPPTSRVDTSLFPRGAVQPPSRTPGRVAVLLRPPFSELEVRGESGPAHQMIVPIGRIVGQALTLAADDSFAGGAQPIDTPAPAGAGHSATLSLDGAWAHYHSRLRWLIPLPLPMGGIGDMDLDVEVGFDIGLIDPQGQPVWQRSYHSGALLWEHSWGEYKNAPEGLLRQTHQAAWQIAQQAVADLRAWVLADRLRPREL